jgi:hypothetical protein
MDIKGMVRLHTRRPLRDPVYCGCEGRDDNYDDVIYFRPDDVLRISSSTRTETDGVGGCVNIDLTCINYRFNSASDILYHPIADVVAAIADQTDGLVSRK